MTIKTSAYAKLNLTLDVLRRRQDGYHELKMVTQTVDLCDDITIELNDSRVFTAVSNKEFLPADERNLAVRAARLFFERAGLEGMGGVVTLHKRIPVCAGLGGGSADAGAVLRALNGRFGRPLDKPSLHGLAAELGSDVPFCLEGGTQLMEGRGELLTPLAPLPDCSVLIAKPHGSLSTPVVFGWLRVRRPNRRPDTAGMLAALESGDLTGVARRVYNVLEDVASENMRELSALHKLLIDSGALGAAMTGTGSAVFGVYGGRDEAEKAADSLSGHCPEIFLTAPVPAITGIY